MKFIAIDYGTKKIGIALSDGLGVMAFAKYVLRYTSQQEVIKRITDICYEQHVHAVVVGIPLYKDKTLSPVAKKVYSFIACLQKEFSAEYFTLNEYLTSYEAKQRIGKGYEESLIDAYSAKVILEDFLLLPEEKRVLHKIEGEVYDES